MLFSAVQVLPGAGTVARTGDVVLWWEDGPALTPDVPARLVELARSLAAGGPAAAAEAGPRIAEVLGSIGGQALSGLVLVLPSPAALRAVVVGAAQVLAPGVDIPRGWVDTELAWPSSMAVGRADGTLRPPVAGSPFDLVEGATPGAGAAIVLAARSLPSHPIEPEPAVSGPAASQAATPAPEPLPVAEPDAVLPPERPHAPDSPGMAEEAGLPPAAAPPPVVQPSGQPAWTSTESTQAEPEPLEAQAMAAEPAPAPPASTPTAAWSASQEAPSPPAPHEAPTVAMPGPPRFSDTGAEGQAAAPAAAEVYGAIVVDDGSVHALDGDYVLGSNPALAPEVGTGTLRSLPLTDAAGQVQPVHAEIRHGGGGALVLIARAPTFLLPPGAGSWQDAPPHHPVPLQPGVVVAIGQRTLRLAGPTARE